MQEHQCLPKPPHLSWAASASYMLEAATAYRMLASWQPHVVQPGDAVLVWGASGGLGSMAIQITKALGGRPIAVVSSDERGEYCKSIGAIGYINRKKFDHWGRLPDWQDEKAMTKKLLGFRCLRQRRSGTSWASAKAPASSSSTPARTRCPPRSSSASPAVWS